MWRVDCPVAPQDIHVLCPQPLVDIDSRSTYTHGNLCIRDGNLNMQSVGKNVFDYSVNN